jgi:hypothetical protein
MTGLLLLSVLASCIDIQPNTSILFVNMPVQITDVQGTRRVVYGGFFPHGATVKISDHDMEQTHFNASFPPTCDTVLVSAVADFRLTLTPRPGELCVWYVAQPSVVHFIVRTLGNAALILHSVDGKELHEQVLAGTREISARSILFQWRADSTNSLADVRAIQAVDALPYRSNFTRIFNVSAAPEYFFAAARPVHRVRHPRGDGEFDHAACLGIVGHWLCLALILGCCCCCCKALKRRMRTRRNGDAVPPAARPQYPVQYYPAQYVPVQGMYPPAQIQYIPVQGMYSPAQMQYVPVQGVYPPGQNPATPGGWAAPA